MSSYDVIEDTEYPDNDEYIPYVTAGNLSQKNGAKVTLWGKVTRITGEGFYILTADEQEVLVKTKKPLSESLKGWYEISGVSQGKSVLCEDYVPFKEESTKKIDTKSHIALAKLLAALDDPWDLGNETQS